MLAFLFHDSDQRLQLLSRLIFEQFGLGFALGFVLGAIIR